MNKAETATRALVLTTIVAIVVGGYSLIPHFRAERFVPIILDGPANEDISEVIVRVSGDGTNPGLYTLDTSTSLAEVMRLVLQEEPGAPDMVSLVIDAAAESHETQRVDLNHADVWLLDALPGIGPDRARAIVTSENSTGRSAAHRNWSWCRVSGTPQLRH